MIAVSNFNALIPSCVCRYALSLFDDKVTVVAFCFYFLNYLLHVNSIHNFTCMKLSFKYLFESLSFCGCRFIPQVMDAVVNLIQSEVSVSVVCTKLMFQNLLLNAP